MSTKKYIFYFALTKKKHFDISRASTAKHRSPNYGRRIKVKQIKTTNLAKDKSLRTRNKFIFLFGIYQLARLTEQIDFRFE